MAKMTLRLRGGHLDNTTIETDDPPDMILKKTITHQPGHIIHIDTVNYLAHYFPNHGGEAFWEYVIEGENPLLEIVAFGGPIDGGTIPVVFPPPKQAADGYYLARYRPRDKHGEEYPCDDFIYVFEDTGENTLAAVKGEGAI